MCAFLVIIPIISIWILFSTLNLHTSLHLSCRRAVFCTLSDCSALILLSFNWTSFFDYVIHIYCICNKNWWKERELMDHKLVLDTVHLINCSVKDIKGRKRTLHFLAGMKAYQFNFKDISYSRHVLHNPICEGEYLFNNLHKLR